LGRRMGYAAVRDFMLNLANAVMLEKGRLDELDAACGDGDFGVGMYVGFEGAKKAVGQVESSDIGRTLTAAGQAILSSVGGASGVLFGTLFMEAGRVASGRGEIGVEDLSKMFGASLERIRQRGGAKLGDKTLVDALEPAVESLRDSARGNLDLKEALRMAADAARGGAESTRGLIAKKGRARYLGEQTLGHVDPGAEVIRLIFETLLDTYQSEGCLS